MNLIKEAARQFFSACGYEIRNRRGSTRTSLEGALHQIRKVGFVPQTAIDVGVAYGTFELYETFPEAYQLLVEPLQEYEGVLKEIGAKFRGSYVIAAASDKAGSVTLNVHPDLPGSSILHQSEGAHADGVPREVPTVTLDHLALEKKLSGPYLLKADVQGAELQVLSGAPKILKETEVVILEVSLLQGYKGVPQFYEVVSYLKERGFVVYDIFGGHIRPLDGALAQIDLAFVKEDGLFRRDHSYATAKQRKELSQRLSAGNPKSH